LSTKRSIPLNPQDWELDRLHRDRELRADLAAMTIAKVLQTFKAKALIAGGWSPEGGASLTTYFMGAVIYAFAGEFRRDRTQAEKGRREIAAAKAVRQQRRRVAAETPLDADAAEYGLDPSSLVPSQMEVNDTLQRATDREKVIVALRHEGYTHEEIAEVMGDLTPRSIEGVMYRWRKKEQRLRLHRERSEQQ
jgi:DNA-directed RNA polymerase specialized sigma24 family protein